MNKATDAQIIDFIKNIYKGEFKSMSVESIETGKADKYGSVKHNVFAVTVWNDDSKTHNMFSCNEQNGELYN
ncbi:hypothetical protein BARRETLEMON_75 [Arthrobacter phage BarretLemon]|uniref:Uncharacterized protein n=4 Tax=Marthavirus barretlemon TaxID=2560300 RepID=A0A386KQQ7_9CAUD|nr:hypothetical protein BJD79_gp75 [Arthrobacter phage BarretLemon]AMM44537.1 hypothetical protein BARRETLEMON_75 [Arthrobacter phage BarretLemon]ASR78105.1 hypothetical protein SEA_TIMINATOR_76 [Arthrobacter phage Timinator]AYD86547.1 hypothetical protein SEA_LEEROYJ_76 [Arthrobacter phage LeeroyJ]QJD53406.1 hypothetical protein SEA_STEVIEBAY_76 [Arthrobacter phage StevieBAY]